MSGITFTSHNQTSSVRGTEHAYGLALAIELTIAALDLGSRDGVERARAILPPIAFMRWRGDAGPDVAVKEWVTANSISGDGAVMVGDVEEPICEVVLNTAIVDGSDAVGLLARIFGSADHGLYVDAADQAWLAGVIAEGRRTGTLRPDMGWESVVNHLSTDLNSGVLITTSQSFTATDIQLRATGASYDGIDEDELDRVVSEWEQRPVPQRWELSRDAVRDERNHDGKWWLTLAPDTFHQPAYLKGATIFTALAQAPHSTPATVAAQQFR